MQTFSYTAIFFHVKKGQYDTLFLYSYFSSKEKKHRYDEKKYLREAMGMIERKEAQV